MASKIGIKDIVLEHFSTFADEDGSRSISDWALLVFLPIFIGIGLAALSVNIADEAYTNIVTAGAIFTGLLLNLLVLIYDQKTRLSANPLKSGEEGYDEHAIRNRVISEVHFNVSYCIFVCLILVVFSVIGSAGVDHQVHIPKTSLCIDIGLWVVDLPIFVLSLHLVLTILMILKRVHKLIATH